MVRHTAARRRAVAVRVKTGILPDPEWEALVKCERKGRDRCGVCSSCRIQRHHESVVLDLVVRKNRLADELTRLFRRYEFRVEGG